MSLIRALTFCWLSAESPGVTVGVTSGAALGSGVTVGVLSGVAPGSGVTLGSGVNSGV